VHANFETRGVEMSKPWEVARDRLQSLPCPPTAKEVADAVEPIGLPAILEGHEAMRLLSLLDAEKLKTKVLPKAKAGRYYDPVLLVQAVCEVREATRSVSRSSSRRHANLEALMAVDADARRELESARAVEARATEEAKAYEALAKSDVSPTWVARSKRQTARDATRRRKFVEDSLLKRMT
jgi:hypothetical protein